MPQIPSSYIATHQHTTMSRVPFNGLRRGTRSFSGMALNRQKGLLLSEAESEASRFFLSMLLRFTAQLSADSAVFFDLSQSAMSVNYGFVN